MEISPTKTDPAKPFDGDCFGRKEYADRLTNLVNRLPDGGVIAIDAPWGEGKTWFGENWHNQLKIDGYRTAYINAFERDYVEDPFVMLAAEITKGVGERSATVLKSAGLTLAKALAATAGKIAVNATFQILGTSDIDEKMSEALENASGNVSDAAGKFLLKRIESYEKDRASVVNFKKELANVANSKDEPIVIFIDELDRCRPDFAVKTIERIKHFFETKNVVFVLLVNKTQLHAAIRGLYGEINAEDYLGKFLHITVNLPKSLEKNFQASKNDNVKYCAHILINFGFTHDPNGNIDRWSAALGTLATNFKMSLRDIERSVSLYILFNSTNALSANSAWLIALKIKKPQLFQGIKNNDSTAHQEAIKLLSEVDLNESLKERLGFLHSCAFNPNAAAANPKLRNTIENAMFESSYRELMDVLPSQAKTLDCAY